MTAPKVIRDFNKQHGHSKEDVVFVRLLRARGMNNKQIADIINVLETVCKYCYNRTWPCFCSRDE